MHILDIHTHLLPPSPGTALVSATHGESLFEEDQLYSVGLHPWYATSYDEKSLQTIESMLALPQVLAVGECGFDTLRGPAHSIQESLFVRQVELSEQYAKPMILHVVRDYDTIIKLRKELRPTQNWLIHGFRGGPELLHQLMLQGLSVSFGLRHNVRSICSVPMESLFLETDGQTTIESVIAVVARELGVTEQVVEQQVVSNSHQFLKAPTSICD